MFYWSVHPTVPTAGLRSVITAVNATFNKGNTNRDCKWMWVIVKILIRLPGWLSANSKPTVKPCLIFTSPERSSSICDMSQPEITSLDMGQNSCRVTEHGKQRGAHLHHWYPCSFTQSRILNNDDVTVLRFLFYSGYSINIKGVKNTKLYQVSQSELS